MKPGRGRTLVPLFPLPDVVLFPRVQVPLHVFEERYRQLTALALAGDRTIGMVTVRPERIPEMAGDPPVFPVGCAGAIVRERRRPDGRYDLLLEGRHRFRIERELPPEGERLFRIAEVELLDDPIEPVDEPRIPGLRRRALDAFGEIVRRFAPDRADELDPEQLAGVEDALLVNALCQMLELDPLEKQGLLEAESIPRRYEKLLTVVRFRLAEASGPVVPGSGRPH